MTPFAHPTAGVQQLYNDAHSRTRVGVEQFNGQSKRRFMILHSEIRVPLARVSSIIGACAVLHNFAKDNIQYLPDNFDEPINYVQPPFREYRGGENINAYITAFANAHFG